MNEEVKSLRVMPASAVAEVGSNGKLIRLTLLRPANILVLVNDLEKLFLLADTVEKDPPVPGQPGVVSALACGADPKGHTLATQCLQRAIDEVAGRGGGTVYLPEGVFLTGTLSMRNHVTLYLAPGAVLQGSSDPADYPIDSGRHESGSDSGIKSSDQRYQGETMTFSRLLLFDGAEDAHIAGRGTIDGDGSQLRNVHHAVPNLIRIRASHGVSVRDVLLRDAAAWTVHVLASRHVRLENIRLFNDRSNLNTDGIDPDSSQDVVIRGCVIHTKDDGVCVKATNNSGLVDDVAHVEVVGNIVSSRDAALKVGSESQAASFKDIVFEDNDILEANRAISIVVRDGATYSHVVFKDTRVGPGVEHLIEQVIGLRGGRQTVLGHIEDLVFENVQAPDYKRPKSNRTWYAQFRPGSVTCDEVPVFQGADAEHAVKGLHLRNVVVNGVRLTDRAIAEKVANLQIGPFVEDATFE